jgi:hypothetical protein
MPLSGSRIFYSVANKHSEKSNLRILLIIKFKDLWKPLCKSLCKPLPFSGAFTVRRHSVTGVVFTFNCILPDVYYQKRIWFYFMIKCQDDSYLSKFR